MGRPVVESSPEVSDDASRHSAAEASDLQTHHLPQQRDDFPSLAPTSQSPQDGHLHIITNDFKCSLLTEITTLDGVTDSAVSRHLKLWQKTFGIEGSTKARDAIDWAVVVTCNAPAPPDTISSVQPPNRALYDQVITPSLDNLENIFRTLEHAAPATVLGRVTHHMTQAVFWRHHQALIQQLRSGLTSPARAILHGEGLFDPCLPLPDTLLRDGTLKHVYGIQQSDESTSSEQVRARFTKLLQEGSARATLEEYYGIGIHLLASGEEVQQVSHADARLFPIVARTLAEKVPETVQICRSLHRLVLEPLMLDSPPHEELVRFVASDDSDDPKLLSFILSLT